MRPAMMEIPGEKKSSMAEPEMAMSTELGEADQVAASPIWAARIRAVERLPRRGIDKAGCGMCGFGNDVHNVGPSCYNDRLVSIR